MGWEGVGVGTQVTSGCVPPPPTHTHTHTLLDRPSVLISLFFSYFVCLITLLLFIDIFQALIIANLKI